jgi:hypothetical protein
MSRKKENEYIFIILSNALLRNVFSMCHNEYNATDKVSLD